VLEFCHTVSYCEFCVWFEVCDAVVEAAVDQWSVRWTVSGQLDGQSVSSAADNPSQHYYSEHMSHCWEGH